MSKLTTFVASWCPHCRNAEKWFKELQEENPDYKNVEVEFVDYEKNPQRVQGHEFYYVPTIYDENDEKVFEGAPSKKIIEDILIKYSN